MPEQPLIWQPSGIYQPDDFSVNLLGPFAELMIKTKLSSEKKHIFNFELGYNLLQRYQIKNYEPFTFYEDTCFVNEFHLCRGGIYLVTHFSNIENLLRDREMEKPIVYHTHNAESSSDRLALLALFDMWVQYAEILREK